MKPALDCLIAVKCAAIMFTLIPASILAMLWLKEVMLCSRCISSSWLIRGAAAHREVFHYREERTVGGEEGEEGVCVQSWVLSVFLNLFSAKKMIFCIFYQVNFTGSGLFK